MADAAKTILLDAYAEAVSAASASGRTVVLRVEVDPSGSVAIERSFAVGDTEAASTPQDPELEEALERARRRGADMGDSIVSGSDMLGLDEFARLLGVEPDVLLASKAEEKVLGLNGFEGRPVFPVWQLDSKGAPHAAIPALFDLLGGGPWSVYRFLAQGHPELEGMTGREALGRGLAVRVLKVAEGIGRGTFS